MSGPRATSEALCALMLLAFIAFCTIGLPLLFTGHPQPAARHCRSCAERHIEP